MLSAPFMGWIRLLFSLLLIAGASAQTTPSLSERWSFFEHETVTPLTAVGGAYTASVSQLSQSEPRYGEGARSLSERFGAALADTTGQNFFVDFVMASALHQDTRYARRGPAYGGVWARARYAIASAFVTHTNSGDRVFNWSNLAGTALSTGLSDLYYPTSGRKMSSMSIRFGTNVVSTGLAALFPEFWPDFRGILQRHHLIPRRH